MPSILITPAAEEDLISLWLYIARDNQDAADRVYQAAERTFKNLADMPRMGTPYQSRRVHLKDVRFFPVKDFHNYVVYYLEQPKGIKIIRVLHAHMQKIPRLEPEG